MLASPCQLQVTASLAGNIDFDWSYVTADPDGPAGDIFGVMVDGQRFALSDLGGATAQTGHGSFTALSSFGWFVNCTDCIGGFATVAVAKPPMQSVQLTNQPNEDSAVKLPWPVCAVAPPRSDSAKRWPSTITPKISPAGPSGSAVT